MDNITNSTIPQTTRPRLPGVSKLSGRALFFYKQHFALITGISAIPFIFDLARMLSGKSLPISLLSSLATISFVANFLASLALFAVAMEEKQSIAGAYRKGLSMLVPAMWVSILVTLITLGGFFLFVIPGIIISILLSFSLYALLAENRRDFSALVSSWHYVRGYWMATFWRVSFLGLAVLFFSLTLSFITNGSSALTALKNGVEPEMFLLSQVVNLAFNNFFILPFSIIYSYGIYRSLKEIKASTSLESDKKKISRNIMFFFAIGILGIVAVVALVIFLLPRFLPQFLPVGGVPIVTSQG